MQQIASAGTAGVLTALGGVGLVILGALVNQIGQAIVARRTERRAAAMAERGHLRDDFEELRSNQVAQGIAIARILGRLGMSEGEALGGKRTGDPSPLWAGAMPRPRGDD